MVTRILFDPRRDLPTGSNVFTAVIVEATPTGVREDGSVVVLPSTLSFAIDSGDDVLQLVPTTASWKWRIVVRDTVTRAILQQRTVLVPDVASIPYQALPDVDPASLGDTVTAARNWDATFAQILDLMDGIVAGELNDASVAMLISTPTSATAEALAASLSATYVQFGATAPDPTKTTVWIDTSVVPQVVKGYNGTAWVAIGAGGSTGTAIDDTTTSTSKTWSSSKLASTFPSQLVVDGATTTAAINTWLAAASPLGVKKLVGVANITAPLIIPSNTRLDAYDAAITLTASAPCNMVRNAGLATSRTVWDAVTTAGSATITSATAAFASGDVGKPILVWAGNVQGQVLETTISAVSSATTATLAATVPLALAKASISIGTRDANIQILGGRWDRASIGGDTGQGINAHSLVFRRVDNLTIRDVTVTSAAGKYSIHPADVRNLRVQNINFGTASDGLHINGPAEGIVAEKIYGRTHDDMVAIMGADYAAFTDTSGPISNVSVDTVTSHTLGSTSQPASAVKLLPARDFAMTHAVVRNVFGVSAGSLVKICEDPGDPLTTGGVLYGCTIENVQGSNSYLDANGAHASLIEISVASIPDLIIRGLRSRDVVGASNEQSSIISVFGTAGSTKLGRLVIEDVEVSGSQYVNLLTSQRNHSLVKLKNVRNASAITNGNLLNAYGTIDQLLLRENAWTAGYAITTNAGAIASIDDPTMNGSSYSTFLTALRADAPQRIWEASLTGFVDRSYSGVGTKVGTGVKYGQPALLTSGNGSAALLSSATASVDTSLAHNDPTAFTLLLLAQAPAGIATGVVQKLYSRNGDTSINWGHPAAPYQYACEVLVSGGAQVIKWHAGTPSTGTTYLIMLTFDGSNLRTYRASTTSDAALISTVAAAGTLTSNSNTGIIGNSAAGGSQPFPGLIQHVMVSDKVTSLARFQAYATAAFS